MRRRLIAALCVLCVLPIILAAFNLADRFLYHPMRYPAGNWELQAQAGAQEQWIVTPDHVRLNCAWYARQVSEPVTLFLHGNAGNVTHRIDHGLKIQAAGSGALIVDYRGYGKSEGHPSEAGLYTDADAVYAALLKIGYRPDQIILHGESLGTAVATDLASRKPCAGLILEAPFMSVSKMAGGILPVIGPLIARGFDTYSKIAKVHVPVLVIHGDADEVVPFEQGEAVFQRANEPKQFWRIHGGHHNDLVDVAGPQYEEKLRAFYASLTRR